MKRRARPSPFVVSAIVVAVTTATGQHAYAQAPQVDQVKVNEAKQRMVEGKRLYGERKYEEAWLKFVQACAVLNTDKCITGLAITEHAAGKSVDAYDHTRYLLEPQPKPSLTADQVKDLTQTKNEAYAKTGHVNVSAPEGALISVDDVSVGAAPLKDTVTVMPGTHRVEAKVGGHVLAKSVDVPAASVTAVALEEPAAPPSPIAATVTPSPASAARPLAPPSDESRDHDSWVSSPVVPIALGLVAAGLASGGAISLANASSDKDRAERLRTQYGITASSCVAQSPGCSEVDQAVSSQVANQSRAVGFFIGAGVAATGVVAWFVWGRPSATVTPVVSPGVAGASVQGRF